MMALRSSVTLTGPSDFSSQSLCSSLKRASVSSGSSSPRLGDDGPTPGGGNVGWARADSGRPAGPRPLGLEPLGHGCGNGLDSLTSVPRDCCRPGVPPDAGCPDDSLAASWDVRTRRQGISRRQVRPTRCRPTTNSRFAGIRTIRRCWRRATWPRGSTSGWTRSRDASSRGCRVVLAAARSTPRSRSGLVVPGGRTRHSPDGCVARAHAHVTDRPDRSVDRGGA